MVSLHVMDDAYYMRRALRLASKAAGRTSPNPAVGAVLVKGRKIISEDYHKKAGEPHAEALAIAKAGASASGATLYVTLEPCCHRDKRTPPCTDAIIKAGIRRVVAAMKDPNPKVSGKGIKTLKEAGIGAEAGLLERESSKLNEAYIKFITTGRPFVILKAAMTLDGKIATPEGRSKWITGEKARRLVHKTRSEVDAVLTAIGTVKADDPEMTSRISRNAKQPKRIVIDPRLEISPEAKILKQPPETIIVSQAERGKKKLLINKGVKLIKYKGKLELNRLMKMLAEMGIMSVLIEGGASLNAHAFNDGIVDKVMFFIAPKIIGGRASIPVVGGETFRTLENACRISDVTIKRVGDDFLIEGYVA